MVNDKMYMVDLLDPHNPGKFCSEGPMTEARAMAYLGLWGLAEAAFHLFCTRLDLDSSKDPA